MITNDYRNKMISNGFGKIHASMYTGSMYGSGAMMFAVMGYVVANMLPVGDDGMQVELNPEMLRHVLGEDEKDVRKAIETLCSPDPKSRTKQEEGRRLVKLGEFEYRVVNGPKYRAIRAKEVRLEQNRVAQKKFRSKRSGTTQPTQSEKLQQQAEENGEVETAQRLHELRDNVAEGSYAHLYPKSDEGEQTPF